MSVTLGLNRCVRVALGTVLFCGVSAAFGQNSPPGYQWAVNKLRALPLAFEVNQGQGDSGAHFLVHSPEYSILLTREKVDFLFPMGPPAGNAADNSGFRSGALSMQFVGAQNDATVTGTDEASGSVNYYYGKRSSAWHQVIPRYQRVIYRSLYPGIDLAFHGSPVHLEYDFTVSPQSDTAFIRLGFKGAKDVRIDSSEALVLRTGAGEIRFEKPVLYQEIGTEKRRVAGGFKITAANQIGFWVGPYDHELPLIIDPVLTYATYFSSAISAVAIDGAGNIYVAGQTGGNLPTQSAFQGSLSGSWDGFVSKFDPTGQNLIFSTYFGGSGNDWATAMALDPQGNAYITGVTGSTDFPTTPGAFMTQCPGGICDTPFVAKFSPTGSLVYSTLTGSSAAGGRSIAVDTAGDAYITGTITYNDLPVVNAFQPTFAGTISTTGSNAFVQKVDPSGSQLLYSTYLGGGSDFGTAIAVDSSESAYVVGGTGGNFPTQNPLQSDVGTLFLTKFSPQGNTLVYSTLLGGGGQADIVNAVAVDSGGNAYLAGQVGGVDFPLNLNSFQTYCYGAVACWSSQAFALAMNSSGTGLLYSTLLGDGSASAIAVDASANAYVAGVTGSGSFPVLGAVQSTQQALQFGSTDGFVTKLNASGVPTFSTFLGGFGTADYASAIAVDSAQNIVVAGQTSFTSNLLGPDFPVVKPFQAFAGCCFQPAGFLARISPSNTAALSVSSLQPLVVIRNVSSVAVSISNIAVSSPNVSFTSGGTCHHPMNLAAGSECFLVVQQASGTVNVPANIVVTSNAPGSPETFVALPAVSGFPSLLYSPAELQFGPQFVGTTSPPQSITVFNTTLQAVSIGNIQMSGADFSMSHNCPSSLKVGGTCSISVRFTPTGSTTGGNLTINWGNGGQDDLFISGQTSPTSLSVKSQGYTFGTQYVGVPGMSRVVTLSNATPTRLSVSGVTVSGPFSTATNCGASIPAQGTCRVAVTFVPTGNGPATGTLTVSVSGSSSPATVSLTGLGKIFSDLAVSALTLDFGQAYVGYAANGQQLTLTNVSGSGLTISGFSLSDPQFSQANNCPVSPNQLGPGNSCTLNLTFAATALGPQSATLAIQHTGKGNPQILSLTGTGVTPIYFAPASLLFGSQIVGTSSAQLPIAVSNNFGTPITIQSIVVHGDFQIVQNPCPGPGQQLPGFFGCALQIVFTPTATGTRTGDVTVVASDEPFPHIAQITGTGIVPDFSLSATSGTTSVTVNAGQAAVYNLQLTSIGSFNGSVAFTCSGTPKAASCSVSPNPVSLSGSTAPFVVTITTAAFSAKASGKTAHGAFIATVLLPWTFALVALVPVTLPSRMRFKMKAVLGSILLMCLLGCGGGGGTGTPPPVNNATPPGTYSITLTASSGGTTHTVNLSLTVR